MRDSSFDYTFGAADTKNLELILTFDKMVEFLKVLTQATATVNSVSFSPDGNYIAYGDRDDNVYIHSTSTWALEETLTQATSSVISVSFSPDGNYIAYGSSDDNVYVEDTLFG